MLENKRWFFALMVVAYVLTAYNSVGYYHADEHYQIIEFAGYQIGTNQVDELPWEFQAQMRPTLQVWIAVLVIKVSHLFGISNPYTISFLLRLLTSVLCMYTLYRFYSLTKHDLKTTNKNLYLVLTFLLWFIPFVGVRYSAETWSGLLFILGLTFYQEKKQLAIAGILFGVSIVCRLQITLALTPLLLWMLVDKNMHIKSKWVVISTTAIIIVLGSLLDSLFYGEFVFTMYNYFKENILNNMAAGFGIEPWYFYILKTFSYTGYFIGVPLLIGSLYILAKDRKNLYNICFLSFLLIHSLVSHKEMRFLFPMAFFAPYLLMKFVDLLSNKHNLKIYSSPWFSVPVVVLFLFANSIGLIALSQKAAGIGRMEITKYIHQNFQNDSIALYHTKWANPYNPWGGSLAKFYLDDNVEQKEIEHLDSLDSIRIPKRALFVCRGFDMKDNHRAFKNFEANLLAASLPKRMSNFNKFIGGFDNGDVLYLYELRAAN